MMKNILFVHGIYDSGDAFNKMSRFLRQNGWHTHTFDLKPNNGAVPLNQLAEQIVDYEQKHLPQAHQFTLLGFSMGGVVSRYYLQRLGGMQRVRRFISISTPHHGTLTAYLMNNPGGRQLRPNSEFLVDLNTDIERLNEINHVSIWTPFDLMIVPATSSIVPDGRNIFIPVLLHSLVLRNQRCINMVKRICDDMYPE
jgi:triacylglycerol lipase